MDEVKKKKFVLLGGISGAIMGMISMATPDGLTQLFALCVGGILGLLVCLVRYHNYRIYNVVIGGLAGAIAGVMLRLLLGHG